MLACDCVSRLQRCDRTVHIFYAAMHALRHHIVAMYHLYFDELHISLCLIRTQVGLVELHRSSDSMNLVQVSVGGKAVLVPVTTIGSLATGIGAVTTTLQPWRSLESGIPCAPVSCRTYSQTLPIVHRFGINSKYVIIVQFDPAASKAVPAYMNQ